MKEFRAKEIEFLIIGSRMRYEYLATKMGIKPDIEEVEGRGRAHVYSIRNACQFFLADHLSSSGLSPRIVRIALEMFNELGEEDKTLFDEGKSNASIYIFRRKRAVALCVKSGVLSAWKFTWIIPENALTGPEAKAAEVFIELSEMGAGRLAEKVDSYFRVNWEFLKAELLYRIDVIDKIVS